MSWVPGRGRPIAMPHDPTPLRGRAIDARARVAWLLRLSRLAVARGPAGNFVEQLREHGCALGPSTLCRYETGAEPVPASVVRGYASALGLPPGQLLGVSSGLDRMFGGALASVAGPAFSRDALSDELGTWERNVAAGTMRGIDWVHAATVISSPTGPVFPPSLLRTWVAQLVTETMRSVEQAYTTRMYAVSLLLSDQSIGRNVLDTIAQLTAQPGAQRVTPVLAVLGNSSDPDVSRWLVRHFAQSAGERRWGAAYGLLGQICRGTLPGELVPDLSRAILDAAGDGLEQGRSAFMLAQRMSVNLTQQVVARLGRYPAPRAAGARVQSPAALRHYRAAALRESGLDDPMLDRLLREALSPDFVERRHHSSLLLAASPYRDVLADVAIGQVHDPVEPYAARSAAHLLRYLGRPDDEGRLSALLVMRPDNRRSLLVALAHCGRRPSIELAPLAADPSLAADVVYAAGMTGHPDLQWFATRPELAGTELQQTAAWWLRTGPAVTDAPPIADGAPMSHDVLELAG